MSSVLVAWDVVRDTDAVPDGVYHVKVETFDLDNHDDGRLIAKMRATIVGPKDYEGSSYFQRFFLGTQDDPDFVDPATMAKSISLKQLKQFGVAAGVALQPSLAAFVASLVGCEVLISNKQSASDSGGIFNNIGRIWKLGEKAIGLTSGKQASTRPRVVNGSGAHAPADAPTTPRSREAQFEVVEE